jgi:hypothetical protein
MAMAVPQAPAPMTTMRGVAEFMATQLVFKRLFRVYFALIQRLWATIV